LVLKRTYKGYEFYFRTHVPEWYEEMVSKGASPESYIEALGLRGSKIKVGGVEYPRVRAISPSLPYQEPVVHATLAGAGDILAAATGVYEAKNIYEVMGMDIPWPWEYEFKWPAIPPGGEPWAVPEIPGAEIKKRWYTGTAEFAILSDGRWAVLQKDGTWKIFRHRKPYVIPSQNLSYKGATRLKRAANKYLKLAKKIAPVLGYRVTRSKRTTRRKR